MKKIYMVCMSVLLLAACAPANQQGSDSTTTYAKGQSTVADDVSNPNILQVAIGSADHSTLVTAVQAAELEDVLVNAGPLTVFAPNNDAFGKIPAETLQDLLKPENKATLARIIKNHASPGSFRTNTMRDGQSMYMATGNYVKVEKSGEDIMVGGAKILGTVEASNGIVHVVDGVILPPEN